MPSQSRRRIERRIINQIAGYVRSAIDWFDRAVECKEGSKTERSALKRAYIFWDAAGILICNSKNRPRTLRLVAAALENKLPINTGWRDDKILAVVRDCPGVLTKSFADIKKRYAKKYGKENLPDDNSLRRTLKRLGVAVAGIPGRPRKKPVPKR